MQNKYTADAFFAGVGGIEKGFTETGLVNVLYANEFDKNAGITYKLNNPSVKFDNRDVHQVTGSDLPDTDMMIGGFPCFTEDALVQTETGFKHINEVVAVPVIKRIADCIIKAIDTPDLQKTVNNQKYVLLKYKLNNKYDGSCYLAATDSDKAKLVKSDTVNERDYFKLIKRNKLCEFSIIERN